MTTTTNRLTVTVPVLVLLLLSRASAASATAADNTDTAACTLDCPVDAPCTLGDATFSHSNDVVQLETNFQGMHCACPPGWTGILCDHKYESCSDSRDCFHGGKCTEDAGWTDAFGNPQLLCDCTDAVTNTGIRYVGKYCETPFEKACRGHDNDDTLFCVNGADCNPDYE